MVKSFDLMVELAKRYYMESMSQSEIAALYNISRPTVANMLKECREKGIVEIRINDRSPFSTETGLILKNKFNLQTVCIVNHETDYPLTLYKICLETAGFLSSLLTNGMKIGISWGTALYHTIRQLPKLGLMDCEVVQLMAVWEQQLCIMTEQSLQRYWQTRLMLLFFLFFLLSLSNPGICGMRC